MPQFKITDIWDVLEKIKLTLETDENKKLINDSIKVFQSNVKLKGVIVGDYRLIGGFPCINLEPSGVNIKVAGTNYTFENTIPIQCGVYVKSLKRRVEVKYLTRVVQTVIEILMHKDYSCIEMPNGPVYNLNVFGNTQLGWVQGGSVRAALIPVTAVAWRSGRGYQN